MDNSRSRRTLTSKWDTLPQLEAVRVFVAVAELRSFRGAAVSLGMPRSTVSRRLTTLEASLGTRLLQRTTRQVSLTAAGEIFLTEVTPALQAIADVGQRMLDADGEPRGLVRLTAPTSLAKRVGEILLDVVERYPRVRVELDFTDRRIDLVAERFDLALRAGKLEDSGLVARPVSQSQNGYYASPEYLARTRRLTHPSVLAEHECVVFSGSSRGHKWSFQIGERTEEFPVRGRVVANSVEVAHLAALRGYGVAWLPAPVARDDVARGMLTPVLKKFWPPPVSLQLVYPSARHLAPQVRAVIELLASRLKRL